jgi:hypothetical protein
LRGKGVETNVVNTAPATLPGARSSTAPPSRAWLISALAALISVVSVVSGVVLVACVVDRALYDPDRIGQPGWKLYLVMAALASIIVGLVVLSGRALSKSQRLVPPQRRHTGAVVAAVLLPGVWLGALTSVPIRTALTAASGSASRPLTASETSAAVSQIAQQIHAPTGWKRTAQSCSQGYVCWKSPNVGFFTTSSYVTLARQFGVRPVSPRCDEAIVSRNGRALQECLSAGVAERYGVVVILEMHRGIGPSTGTELDVAPVRRLS